MTANYFPRSCSSRQVVTASICLQRKNFVNSRRNSTQRLTNWIPARGISGRRIGGGADSSGHKQSVGLSRDRARRDREKALAIFRECFESLSPREREIMLQSRGVA
jgi:hypothetical protein